MSQTALYICTEHSARITNRKKTKYYEFWLITNGTWNCRYKNKTMNCNAGQLLLFQPEMMPSFENHTKDALCYSFQVEKNFFDSYCKQYDKTQRGRLKTPCMSTVLTNSQLGYLTYLLNQLKAPEYNESLPMIKHFLSNALFAFLAEGWHSFGDTHLIYSLDIIRRMDLFYDLSIDVAEIYNHYPVSPTSLIKEFKQISGGYTIVQYRNLKRMEYAAQLLTKDGLSVTATADALNIATPSYFSEQFKKFHGMTPRQYQIKYRNKQ